MSYGKVRNLLLKHGIKLRSNRISKEDEVKIIELAKKGLSARKISKELGINEPTVYRILNKYNLGKKIKRIKENEINTIIQMYNEGKSIYEIAKKLNRSTNLVVYYLKKHGIKR